MQHLHTVFELPNPVIVVQYNGVSNTFCDFCIYIVPNHQKCIIAETWQLSEHILHACTFTVVALVMGAAGDITWNILLVYGYYVESVILRTFRVEIICHYTLALWRRIDEPWSCSQCNCKKNTGASRCASYQSTGGSMRINHWCASSVKDNYWYCFGYCTGSNNTHPVIATAWLTMCDAMVLSVDHLEHFVNTPANVSWLLKMDVHGQNTIGS